MRPAGATGALSGRLQDFTGQAVLVTGSTRGIGRAAAGLLARRGATVGVCGRAAASVEAACEAIRVRGGRAVPLVCDLDRPEAGAEAVREFCARAGRLDGLVNNAGRGRAVAFRGITLDGWRATFRLNLEAAVLAAREAYALMRPQKAGAIVNVASMAAHGPGKWMGADYAASKAALVSVTASLAFEAARFGIRVNAVSPGFIETDMTAPLTPSMKDSLRIPLGRLGRPEEVAETIAFLLSDDAAYVTGEVLHVNGGLRM